MSSISGIVRYGGTSVAAVEASVSTKPGDQLLAVGPGKAPQPQQHPGRGLRRLRARAGRALFGVGRQRRVADRAGGVLHAGAACCRPAPERARCVQSAAPGAAPARGGPGVKRHSARRCAARRAAPACRRRRGPPGAAPGRAPAASRASRWCRARRPAAGPRSVPRPPAPNCRSGAQVNLQRGQNVFVGCELCSQCGPEGAKKDTRGVHWMVMLHFDSALRGKRCTAAVRARAPNSDRNPPAARNTVCLPTPPRCTEPCQTQRTISRHLRHDRPPLTRCDPWKKSRHRTAAHQLPARPQHLDLPPGAGSLAGPGRARGLPLQPARPASTTA